MNAPTAQAARKKPCHRERMWPPWRVTGRGAPKEGTSQAAVRSPTATAGATRRARQAPRTAANLSRVGDTLGSVLGHEAEEVAGHPPHLDLLGALGDPVPPVVAVDVLERLVPAVAQPAEDLHGPVGRFAAQAV